MFRPIIIDPVAFQVTLVVASLLAISVWQKLKTTSGIVIAVYAIYMFSFVSANSKVKSSKPIRLASHEYKYFDNSIKADDSIKIKSSDLEKIIRIRAKGKLDDVSLRVAINQNYVTEDTELKNGDEVAFIPPVQGGK